MGVRKAKGSTQRRREGWCVYGFKGKKVKRSKLPLSTPVRPLRALCEPFRGNFQKYISLR